MTIKYETSQSSIEDLEELTEIFNLYRIFYGQESDLNGARLFLFERIEHRESIIFIVRDKEKDRIVGFTQLYPVFSSISMKRSFILNDLYVIEEYRKQGVAQLLLDEAKKYASLIRAKGIGLSTGVDNKQAQRIYERNGYIKDQEYYHYYLSIKK